jgi:hypothetical protein
MFSSWLSTTRELQTKSFGVDPGELEGAAKADFVVWNHSALSVELGEMMNEYPGAKNWVVDRSIIDRDAFIGEAVDALHFLGNILAAVQCTDQELTMRYLQKVEKNRARMASGSYDGVSDKCPECHRELEVIDHPAGRDVELRVCIEHGVVG